VTQIVKAHAIQSGLTARCGEAPFDVIADAKNQAVWIVGCISSQSFKLQLEARCNRDVSFLHCLCVERLNVQESILEIDIAPAQREYRPLSHPGIECADQDGFEVRSLRSCAGREQPNFFFAREDAFAFVLIGQANQ